MITLLFQWHRDVLGVVANTQRSEEEEKEEEEEGETIEDDVTCELEWDIAGDVEDIPQTNQSEKFYPPTGDNAVKLVKYLFSE